MKMNDLTGLSKMFNRSTNLLAFSKKGKHSQEIHLADSPVFVIGSSVLKFPSFCSYEAYSVKDGPGDCS